MNDKKREAIIQLFCPKKCRLAQPSIYKTKSYFHSDYEVSSEQWKETQRDMYCKNCSIFAEARTKIENIKSIAIIILSLIVATFFIYLEVYK